MGADDLRRRPPRDRPSRAIRRAPSLDGRGLAVEADVDAFVLEDIGDGLRDVLVLAGDEARPQLDHRDLAAEAAIHLGELEADIAAAEHDEMPGRKSTSIIELLVR